MTSVIQTLLLWDGSYLGNFPRTCIKAKITVKNGFVFQIIKTDTFATRCILKRPRDASIPCILDELKVCFGLTKLGTHRIKISGRMYVMYKCTLNDIPLTKVPKTRITSHVEAEMRRLIAYRFLMCISHTQNTSFLIRKNTGSDNNDIDKDDNAFTPYSLIEPQTFIDQRTVDPSETFLKRWFGEKDFHKDVMKVIPKKICEDWTSFLYRFRPIIEDTIERVDSQYVWITAHLVEKIAKLSEEIS